MDFGIKRIIKQKCFKNGKILMAELEGNNLFSVLVFNENDKLIDSVCNCYFNNTFKSEILKLTRKEYKEKLNQYFYKFT
jgi:hypothetical protein